ncbi:MAG: hypothetical protein AAF490_24420 [Chloroflexota bacterium]
MVIEVLIALKDIVIDFGPVALIFVEAYIMMNGRRSEKLENDEDSN